jgi:hypothetical protein
MSTTYCRTGKIQMLTTVDPADLQSLTMEHNGVLLRGLQPELPRSARSTQNVTVFIVWYAYFPL